jgi:hypothetical protein
MDFVESIMKKFGYVKEKKAENEKTSVSEKPKIDLGVCVPMHAKKKEKDSKKIKFVIKEDEEESPFDKLRKDFEKDRSEFNKEVREITERTPSEPYDYEPELGVESIERTKPVAKPITQSKSPFGKVLFNKQDEEEKENEDELEVASKKFSEGYVPRFSATARQKMGLEEKPVSAPITTGYAQFEVTGVYAGAETMISGIVRTGKLTKRMSAQIGKNTIRVSDLKQSFASVDAIYEGQNGTIFSRGGAGLIRNGDIIEFA